MAGSSGGVFQQGLPAHSCKKVCNASSINISPHCGIAIVVRIVVVVVIRAGCVTIA